MDGDVAVSIQKSYLKWVLGLKWCALLIQETNLHHFKSTICEGLILPFSLLVKRTHCVYSSFFVVFLRFEVFIQLKKDKKCFSYYIPTCVTWFDQNKKNIYLYLSSSMNSKRIYQKKIESLERFNHIKRHHLSKQKKKPTKELAYGTSLVWKEILHQKISMLFVNTFFNHFFISYIYIYQNATIHFLPKKTLKKYNSNTKLPNGSTWHPKKQLLTL